MGFVEAPFGSMPCLFEGFTGIWKEDIASIRELFVGGVLQDR